MKNSYFLDFLFQHCHYITPLRSFFFRSFFPVLVGFTAKLKKTGPPHSADFEEFKLKYSEKIIIVESALLFESGMYLSNNINILVTSPLEIKLQRLIVRDKRNEDDVLKIINSQWDDSKKIKLADFVIENINKLETEKKVKKLMSDIISKYEEN